MKTQYYGASSLDGFIADPQHSLDWLLQFGSVDETSYPEFIQEVGAIAMGSTTYEWILRHQDEAEAEFGRAWPYDQPVWVFTSRDLPRIDGADIRFARGDIRPVHREMVDAAAGKNVWVAGGGDLVGQFFDQGLLDEIIVQITPVTLGGGAPLLPRRITNPPMRLTSMQAYGPFAELRYEIVKQDSLLS